jgi:hypothetical protein
MKRKIAPGRCGVDFFPPIAETGRSCYWAAMKSMAPDSLPTKAALEEIAAFRKSFRQALDACADRMDRDLDEVGAKIAALAAAKKFPSDRVRDLRDMLTLLRGHKVNLEKGRLKDLKKLQGVAEDLALLTEGW